MIGGIGVQKLYRIDPYFITKPLFGLSGTASLPSQVDLYIDGNLMTRQQVPPGAFRAKEPELLWRRAHDGACHP